MKKPVTNIPASILARLRNQSDEMNRPFAEVLQYYAMERFLYRLSKTRHADKFILKGGLLFYVWNISLRRPTRDIDFRGYVAGDSKTLSKIIIETTDSADFTNIIEQVWKFIEHPLQAFLRKAKSTRNWLPNKGWK